jgi:RNA polymerase sigma factor (sigma-70 family)
MTEAISGFSDGPTDADLITLVRAGDSAAYEELFRRHRDVAIRYARRISDTQRAEDLCAEAFTKIFDLLQRGKGPDVAFRAYLLTTVRTSHLNTLRRLSREELVPDHEPVGRMMPVIEDPDARFDQRAICRAFAQLPERWQAALWLTSVEGLGHDEVSEHLGIKANAVASLAFRARAGLRQAYLAEHLLETSDPGCRTTVEQLPSYYRDRLSPRRRHKVEDHLDHCAACTKAALELSDVDSRLGALLAPLALGGFALSGVTAGAGLGTLKGLLATLAGTSRRAGSHLPSTIGSKAAAAVLVAAAAVATGAAVLHDQQPRPAAAIEVEHPAPSEARVVGKPRTLLRRAAHPTVPAPSPTTVAVPAPTSSPTHHPSRTEPKPRTSASADPAPTPSPAPTTTSGSLALGPAVLVGDPTSPDGSVSVELPVLHPVTGATLTVTTTRTYGSTRPSAAGWSCVFFVSGRQDQAPLGSTRMVCTYAGPDSGVPLHLDFHVASQALLTAEITPPTGYVDTSLADNVSRLLLRE